LDYDIKTIRGELFSSENLKLKKVVSFDYFRDGTVLFHLHTNPLETFTEQEFINIYNNLTYEEVLCVVVYRHSEENPDHTYGKIQYHVRPLWQNPISCASVSNKFFSKFAD